MESLGPWMLIGVAGISALFFRVLPVAFSDFGPLQDKNSALYQFLNYSSQSTLGASCYEMVFNARDIHALIASATAKTGLAAALLIAVFAAVARTGRVTTAILAGTFIYAVAA